MRINVGFVWDAIDWLWLWSFIDVRDLVFWRYASVRWVVDLKRQDGSLRPSPNLRSPPLIPGVPLRAFAKSLCQMCGSPRVLFFIEWLRQCHWLPFDLFGFSPGCCFLSLLFYWFVWFACVVGSRHDGLFIVNFGWPLGFSRHVWRNQIAFPYQQKKN